MAARSPDPVTLLAPLLEALPDRLDVFAERSRRIADWTAVVEAAETHDLVAVLAHAWQETGTTLPAECAARVRHVTFLQRSRLHRVSGDMFVVLDALARAGVPTVPLKGPILAERLFADPFMRSSVDLDFLVAERDVDEAIRALAGAGYALESGPTVAYNLRHHHHVGLICPGRDFLVELHFHAFTGFGSTMRADELIGRSVPFDSRHGSVRVLAPEDELIYLVVHAVGHFVVHAKWLLDVKLLLHAHPELDGSLVAERLDDLRMRSAFALGLRDLTTQLGVELPSVEGLPALSLRARLVDLLRATSARLGSGPARTLARLGASALLADSAPASAKFLAHHLARIARRRAGRHFVGLVPEHWSG